MSTIEEYKTMATLAGKYFHASVNFGYVGITHTGQFYYISNAHRYRTEKILIKPGQYDDVHFYTVDNDDRPEIFVINHKTNRMVHLREQTANLPVQSDEYRYSQVEVYKKLMEVISESC